MQSNSSEPFFIQTRPDLNLDESLQISFRSNCFEPTKTTGKIVQISQAN